MTALIAPEAVPAFRGGAQIALVRRRSLPGLALIALPPVLGGMAGRRGGGWSRRRCRGDAAAPEAVQAAAALSRAPEDLNRKLRALRTPQVQASALRGFDARAFDAAAAGA